MKINNLKPYNPDMSIDQEYQTPSDGIHTFQIIKIKEIPKDITGKEGENFILKVIGDEDAGAIVCLPIYKSHPLKWKVSVSENLLAGLTECSGNTGISDTSYLLNTIVCGETKQTTDRNGKIWCNITRFHYSKKDDLPEFNSNEDVPF